MEPDPVIGNSIAIDEEAAEEEVVSENRDDDHVPDHNMRDNAGEKRHERASRPKRGQDYEEVEEKPCSSAVESDGPKCDYCECYGEENDRWNRYERRREDV